MTLLASRIRRAVETLNSFAVVDNVTKLIKPSNTDGKLHDHLFECYERNEQKISCETADDFNEISNMHPDQLAMTSGENLLRDIETANLSTSAIPGVATGDDDLKKNNRDASQELRGVLVDEERTSKIVVAQQEESANGGNGEMVISVYFLRQQPQQQEPTKTAVVQKERDACDNNDFDKCHEETSAKQV